MSPRALLLSAAASLAVASAAAAHHSPAAYDLAASVMLEGVLTEVEWKNPHIYLTIETAAADGSALRQEIEAGPVSGLHPRGLTRDVLKLGERVTVRAAPNRHGAGLTALGIELTTAEGVVYPLGVGARPAADPPATRAEGIEGTWLASLPSFTAYLQSMWAWPQLTAAGRAGVARQMADYRSAEDGCQPLPPPTPMLLPVVMTVEVADDAVVISPDWPGAARRIRLGGEHAEPLVPSPMGDSVGFLEGDALIVDSTGFAPHPQGLSLVAPSGAGKHLVERFELADDGRTLRYQAILEDPEHLAAPVTLTSEWAHRPDLSPTGEACDLEIARRYREQASEPPAAVSP